ncbi:hypothetical protein ACH5RR_033761 [Cinchona calisaya]|uniref:RNase H type-1 domain-containing protein n=1 Tax=Cinchona calisaya TaxID=153742 RepID=A0ABD2YDK5_9GENT
MASGRGIIRDDKCMFMVAFSNLYGCMSSLKVEAHVMLAGIKMALDHAIQRAQIEADSAILIMAVNRKSKLPWRIAQVVWEIQSLLPWFSSGSVVHIFREVNSLVDCLINLALDSDDSNFLPM